MIAVVAARLTPRRGLHALRATARAPGLGSVLHYFRYVDASTTGVSAFDGFSLAAPLWLIETRQGGAFAEVTYLQAEAWGTQYLLAFTTEEKAAKAIATLGVGARARPTRVTGDARMEVVTVVCQIGATGIIVDLDPSTRQCAWSRRLLAAA